ncbi:MAG: S9 family peptidase [Lewinellaceae bacterium]|nr:S9 family peptidase [Saprospiraceae bacterium]MCB9268135.1 S9 family peptidase [Lewinellaceae bacterium]
MCIDRKIILLVACMLASWTGWSQTKTPLEAMDIFQLEHVSSPTIDPTGQRILFVRNGNDIMTDGGIANLWITDVNGQNLQPITSGLKRVSQPLWHPDGERILFVSNQERGAQLFVHWLSNDREAMLTNLQKSPGSISISPDGHWIAMTIAVPDTPRSYVQLPRKPEGAKWAEPAKIIDRQMYRADGAGFLKDEYRQLFILPIDGGTPRQLTTGDFQIQGPLTWSPDSRTIYCSSNRHGDVRNHPRDPELYQVDAASGAMTRLTDRAGPDTDPTPSPDGKYLAYLGYDDELKGYANSRIYLRTIGSGATKCLTCDFDRDVEAITWTNSGLVLSYTSEGETYVARIDQDGKRSELASGIGGLSIGRPYSGGAYSVSDNGTVAYTLASTEFPADLAVKKPGQPSNRLTWVNEDLFSYRTLGKVEMIRYPSSADQLEIQGWIVYPPAFDPAKKYPLILEIHGGPFSSYGPQFSLEIQSYANAGYVVLYTNPRGSTSYGDAFANKIHHNYPGQDYDDLMSGVDVMLAKGFINSDRLYITGGSGGGVLTAWSIGKTDRFRAAVVAKPVINWYSFSLYADNYANYYKYWFPGYPWENQEQFMARSPISLVGHVKTPTMLITGEVDYRTPIAETEQFYGALQLQGIESVMVRIPESGHGIAGRPSYLVSKVSHILAWFDRHP